MSFTTVHLQTEFTTTSVSCLHNLNFIEFYVSMSVIRSFSSAELKAAINGGNIIEQGASCKVYKVSNSSVFSFFLQFHHENLDIYGNLDVLSVRLN